MRFARSVRSVCSCIHVLFASFRPRQFLLKPPCNSSFVAFFCHLEQEHSQPYSLGHSSLWCSSMPLRLSSSWPWRGCASVVHDEGPSGLKEAGSSGLVWGLMERPPEAIGATSEELLRKREIGEPLLAYIVVDKRDVESNSFDCQRRNRAYLAAVSRAWRS